MYFVAKEPHKREKMEVWKADIVLQTIDGLQDNRRRITEGS